MELQLKLAIGSDLAGYDLKIEIFRRLKTKGYDIIDFGCNSSEIGEYPEHAKKVAEAVVRGEYDRGILICGTGQGMAMAANKVKGARAALCYQPFTAIMSREHNNANILATGAWLISADDLEKIIEIWLFGKYTRGIHDHRIQAMLDIENER